jgi:hypothetical protein
LINYLSTIHKSGTHLDRSTIVPLLALITADIVTMQKAYESNKEEFFRLRRLYLDKIAENKELVAKCSGAACEPVATLSRDVEYFVKDDQDPREAIVKKYFRVLDLIEYLKRRNPELDRINASLKEAAAKAEAEAKARAEAARVEAEAAKAREDEEAAKTGPSTTAIGGDHSDDPYYAKYLKYKNRYVQAKNADVYISKFFHGN